MANRDLHVRLQNWGRWSRRINCEAAARWASDPPINYQDAVDIEHAVCRLRGTPHLTMLRMWHQALSNKPRIARVMCIRQHKVGTAYRKACKALSAVLLDPDALIT